MATAASDFELFDNPTDGITRVAFHPTNSDILLSTSWDGNVYLHNVRANRTRAKLGTGAALLDGCFSQRDPTTTCFAGGLMGTVCKLDVHNYKTVVLGKHDGAVKAVQHCVGNNLVVSGSWDATCRFWDPNSNSLAATHRIDLPDKVYAMDLSKDLLLVAMANRQVYLFDTRRPDTPMQRRESSLKYQTRCIAFFPDATGFVIGSVEGRVGVEYVDADDAIQQQKYAFKCHREPCAGATPQDQPRELVYPVNAVAFHPTYGTFATGGSDGVVSVWDAKQRKRVKQLSPKYPSSIASLSFSHDGQYLAVASSYMFEQGEREYHYMFVCS